MRLTLRTLLAYIDKILDPQDQEELAQRVAASDVANDLLHRTRDAARRLRLAAPPLEATGPYSDANTVAEYLDNALPPDDVTQFERRCLDLDTFPDADSYLAEVAACHHVLTMVLAQRAEIDRASKQRMHALPLQARQKSPEPTPSAQAGAAAPAPTPAPVVADTSTVSEVPDYLRASDRPLLGRLLPAIAALLLLGVTLVFALGPNGWLSGPPQPVAGNDNLQGEGGPGGGPVEPPSPDVPPTTPEGAESQPPTEPVEPGDPAMVPPAIPAIPAEPPAEPAGDQPGGASPLSPPPTPPVETGAPTATATPDPTTPPTERPATPPAAPIEPPPSASTTPPVDPVTPEAGSTTEDPAEPIEPAEPAAPRRLGLANSKNQVLLRYSPEDGSWRRLGLRDEIMPGDRLLSLPTYQPAVDFDNRVAMDLFDGTLVDVAKMGESTPSIAITYGRMLLTNTGVEPAELSLTIGEQPGQLVLGPAAALAINVQRTFQPGVDPRESAAPLEAQCYAPLGDVRWEGPGFSVQATERGMWRLTDVMTSPVTAYEEDPDWATGRELTRVEREASPRIEAQMSGEEPIWSQLSIAAQSSRKDERALATILAVHIGQFDSTVQALRDEEQQLSWADEIEALRFAMSRSPALAQAVYDELARQHRRELANDLYEMLVGYGLAQVGATPDEWRVGAMRKLIDWLESDQLDYRVLANYNLEQITGRRGVFNPVGPTGAREKSINRQRARLEDGDLKPSGLMTGN